ncbi:MAG: hypothetical protein DRN92_07645 [Thermoproteota archaeon]|nr:MAG: hypothetical protein DRN92_07645 [Candidatus Korarchaeota archaeon]
MLRFADVFSGPGGLSLGFVLAGWKPVWAIEKGTWPFRTYSYNFVRLFPHLIAIQKDVSSLKMKDITDLPKGLEAVIGGPPCKPFSSANRRRMRLSHEDYNLPRRFIKLSIKLKPSLILMEEVPGFKRFMEKMLLKRLKKAGFHTKVVYLDASEFGVPQRRRRHFLLALNDKSELLNEILERLFCLRSSSSISVGQAICDLPEKAYYGKEEEPLSYRSSPVNPYQEWARTSFGGSSKVTNHVTSKAKRMAEKFPYIRPGENLKKAFSRLPAEIKRTFKNRSAIHSNIYRRLDPRKPSITVTHPRKAVIIHPFKDRIITVREAARLQGFPDAFKFIGPLNAMQQMVADAVPPKLAEAIAKAIAGVLK